MDFENERTRIVNVGRVFVDLSDKPAAEGVVQWAMEAVAYWEQRASRSRYADWHLVLRCCDENMRYALPVLAALPSLRAERVTGPGPNAEYEYDDWMFIEARVAGFGKGGG